MPPGEWRPADATLRINASAKREDMDLTLTAHARDQMLRRDLIMGDLLHLLKTGFVYDRPSPATRNGYFKYLVEGTTPNSEGRVVKAVVIPDGVSQLKIVTIMWRDER